MIVIINYKNGSEEIIENVSNLRENSLNDTYVIHTNADDIIHINKKNVECIIPIITEGELKI